MEDRLVVVAADTASLGCEACRRRASGYVVFCFCGGDGIMVLFERVPEFAGFIIHGRKNSCGLGSHPLLNGGGNEIVGLGRVDGRNSCGLAG